MGGRCHCCCCCHGCSLAASGSAGLTCTGGPEGLTGGATCCCGCCGGGGGIGAVGAAAGAGTAGGACGGAAFVRGATGAAGGGAAAFGSASWALCACGVIPAAQPASMLLPAAGSLWANPLNNGGSSTAAFCTGGEKLNVKPPSSEGPPLVAGAVWRDAAHPAGGAVGEETSSSTGAAGAAWGATSARGASAEAVICGSTGRLGNGACGGGWATGPTAVPGAGFAAGSAAGAVICTGGGAGGRGCMLPW